MKTIKLKHFEKIIYLNEPYDETLFEKEPNKVFILNFLQKDYDEE